MAKALLQSGGGSVSGKKSAVSKAAAELVLDKPKKPKRLSKMGEWLRAHPHGDGLIIHDMRAAMR